MWRIAAKMLWAFEFLELVDPQTGRVMSLDPNAHNPGVLQAPLPFKVQIKARSEAHVARMKVERNEALKF